MGRFSKGARLGFVGVSVVSVMFDREFLKWVTNSGWKGWDAPHYHDALKAWRLVAMGTSPAPGRGEHGCKDSIVR